MRKFPIYIVGCAIATLSGCFAIYPYDKYQGDENPTAAGGNSTSTSSGGGMGSSSGPTSGSSSGETSSSSGGMGGAGGATCSPICSSVTPSKPCDCPLLEWGDRFGAAKRQHAHGIAANPTGTLVAVAGEYVDNGFAIGVPIKPMLLLPPPQVAGKNEIMVFGLNKDGSGAWAGEVIPPNTVQPRVANGVAITANEPVLFVTGYATKSGFQENAFVASFRLMGTDEKANYWDADFGGAGFDAGIAVEHDGNNGAFVLGKSSAGTVGLTCLTPTSVVIPVDGMFVAHFNSGGSCHWLKTFPAANITPKAMTLSASSVWVTGYFEGEIREGTTPIIEAPGIEAMFLIELNRTSGVVGAKRGYGAMDAKIHANSITTGPSANGEGVLYVAGHLRGKPNFGTTNEITAEQTAAFVIQTDDKGDITNSLLFPGSSSQVEEAHATSVTFDQDRLFVAGTFNGPIKVGGSTSTLDGSNPFIAEIDTTLFATKWFHIWKSETEKYQNHSFFATYRSDALYFAGSWIRPITFPDNTTFPNFVMNEEQDPDVIMGAFVFQ